MRSAARVCASDLCGSYLRRGRFLYAKIDYNHLLKPPALLFADGLPAFMLQFLSVAKGGHAKITNPYQPAAGAHGENGPAVILSNFFKLPESACALERSDRYAY